ncbi:MAG: hypothetical protein SVV03_00280 [Candidatus Nanohaloarchaea archaeon]|nr:hypothetical protein [Candidatus Nanohaloarchaea archaeon]
MTTILGEEVEEDVEVEESYKNSDNCLIATHIDPGWDAPKQFRINVKEYLEEEEYGEFIYVSSPYRNKGSYEGQADQVIESSGGKIGNTEVDEILDRFGSITHIGAYWCSCHRRTWRDLLKGLYRIEEKRSYTIDMPLHLITRRIGLASSYMGHEDEGKDLGADIDIRYDINQIYKNDLGQKGEIKRGFLGVELKIQEGSEPNIVWEITTGSV